MQKSPLQFKFEFALWTREMIQEIILKKFKVKLGLSSVSRLLKQLGLICQRPMFKARQQRSQQVKNWLKKVFPKIKSRAQIEKADIYFADEAGIRGGRQLCKTRKSYKLGVTKQFELGFLGALRGARACLIRLFRAQGDKKRH